MYKIKELISLFSNTKEIIKADSYIFFSCSRLLYYNTEDGKSYSKFLLKLVGYSINVNACFFARLSSYKNAKLVICLFSNL